MYDYSTPDSSVPKGNYYMLICKASEQAVRVQQSETKNHYKSKLIGSKINPQDTNQIFMVEKIDTYGTNYEIVCCASDYVFEVDGQQIILTDGKQSKYQIFTLIKAPQTDQFQYYFIKLGYRPELALALEGCLRMATFDPNSKAQQFRFEEVNSITIQNSCIFINNLTGKAIDVPAGSEKHGERIVLWQKNRRWNQRWYFEKVGTAYLIKNVMNGLCLDIAGESRDSGAKIVQWPRTGGTNQLWRFEEAGNKLYKVWSYHEPSLWLAIRKQDSDNGAYLEVCNGQNASMYWRIDGALPR